MYFTAILLNDERVIGSDLLVWYTLCSFSKWLYRFGKPVSAAKIFPSHETIAKRCGLSRRTVQSSIKRLVELGYVEIIETGIKGRSNNYKLHPEAKSVAPEPDFKPAQNLPTPEKNLRTPVQNLRTPVQNLRTNNNNNNKQITRSFNNGAENLKTKKTADDYMTVSQSLAKQRREVAEEMSRPGAYEELQAMMQEYNKRHGWDIQLGRSDKTIPEPEIGQVDPEAKDFEDDDNSGVQVLLPVASDAELDDDAGTINDNRTFSMTEQGDLPADPFG